MKRFALAAAFFLSLSLVGNAHALCGDVNGDEQRTASDALAVLRSAVGQQVELVCAGDGPRRLRFFNPFGCGGQSASSEAAFNGFSFAADTDDVSAYQTVDREQISAIEIESCGVVFSFAGPVVLPPGRDMTFFMALLDPAVYEFPGVDIPAQFLIYDDGTSQSAWSAGVAPDARDAVGSLYGGAVY